jgi:outer membrane lipoprotein-sorting protein
VKRWIVCIALLTAALGQAETMADALARMDASAQQFKALSAHMKRMQYTAVLDESSNMEGSVRLKRVKGSTIGVIEFTKPDPRTVYVNGKTVQVFYPKANTVEVYDASKYTSNIDQLLLLGFGTTSTELKKSYDFKDGGSEKVDGVNTTRIELTPRGAELKKLITKIDMWIPEGQANPVRQKVMQPSKNYELVDYSDVKVNPTLADSEFELKLPAGVKKLYPQK